MATSSDFALKITKLNGSNYRNWAFNIRLYLESLDLFGHVDGSAVSPAEDAADAIKKAFRSASKKAWTYICLAIEPEQQIHVRDTTTAKEAWDALKNQFARESILQKVRLRQSYYTCKFPSGGNMLAHINHMRSLHDQMKEMGINVDDKELAMTLLGSLPEQFKPLITALDAVGEDNLSFEKVKGMLLNDADRMSDTKKAEDAFSAQRGFDRKGKRWPRHDNPRKGDGKTGKSFSGLCHYCQERGHFARDCPKKNPKNDGSNYKNKKSANIVEHEKQDVEEEVINQEALFTSNNNSNPGWIIDSGATQHMTYEWSWLVNYVEFKRPCKVNLGDDRTILAFGKGTYNLVADLGNGSTQNIALKEVLYLPDLKKNLLSVQAMTKLNASIQFDGTECKIMRNSKLLATGKIHEKLYMLMIIPDVEYINVAKEKPNKNLWHCRFGHLGIDSISKLIDENMAEGMNCSDHDKEPSLCESCIMGKQHRAPFPKDKPHRANQPFEIIHSDVCGPMHIKSLGNSRYFVTFIDDHSRYTLTYFLKSKDEVLEKFKEFVNYVNTLGKKVKILRSDNGGEYCSKTFQDYLKEHGIQHQTTVPYNPEQNGTPERMNRTLLEAARSMMYHASIPKEFWAEAVSTATYTRNRSPTRSLNNTTPFECLFNRKPDVSNLKVFGCVAYTHIPGHQRKKLEEKSRKCIFVGYPDGTKGFKLYDLTKGTFIRSRDVIFEERTFHEFKREKSSEQNSELFHPPKENYRVDPPINQDEIQADDENVNVEDNGPQPILENNIPPPENDNNRVGATYEDNFMREVENIDQRRQRRPPQRYDELYNCSEDLTADINEPSNISEAWNGKNSAEWKKAAESEYKSLIDNHTWDLVPPPEDKNVVGSKWVFKVKRKADGTIQRFKGRLVAQGYTQSPGTDYDEVFAPVVRYTSIRSLLAVANICNWEIHQMDVKTAFLQGNLNEEIYMKQPDGFIDREKPDYVCKLNKGIYGLKQAARCWNNSINDYLLSNGYTKSTADPCVYIKTTKSQDGRIHFVIIAIYVDDMMFFSNNTEMLEREKKAIAKRFQVEDLGELHYVLGMDIVRDREQRTISISQKKYLEGVLKKFDMENCKPVSTPLEFGKKYEELSKEDEQFDTRTYQRAIGCLTYAATISRPDLSTAVSVLSKFMSKPGVEHWKGVKRVLRYVQGTLDYGLMYSADDTSTTLTGYTDADWAGDLSTRRSTTGYVFQVQGNTVSWCSKRQGCVARSTTEAEYIALSTASQEAVWLRRLLESVLKKQDKPITLYEDNQGTIELTKNPKFHNRTKHIDVSYHYAREQVDNKIISLKYCRTENMLADVMTKGLTKTQFEKFRDMLGLIKIK